MPQQTQDPPRFGFFPMSLKWVILLEIPSWMCLWPESWTFWNSYELNTAHMLDIFPCCKIMDFPESRCAIFQGPMVADSQHLSTFLLSLEIEIILSLTVYLIGCVPIMASKCWPLHHLISWSFDYLATWVRNPLQLWTVRIKNIMLHRLI